MSRWADTFAALSESDGSDTVDTLRHNSELASTVSHSVDSVTPPPKSATATTPSPLDRALATWGESEEKRTEIIEFDDTIPYPIKDIPLTIEPQPI
jgi:hypothetical protein